MTLILVEEQIMFRRVGLYHAGRSLVCVCIKTICLGNLARCSRNGGFLCGN
jgi:hypothetical protein